MLTLDGPNSYAYPLKLPRTDGPAERFGAPIGLDGRYRTGPPRPDGTVPVARGAWSYDGSLVVQFENLGNNDQQRAILTFKDKAVDVLILAEDGRSITVHGEAGD